ncbi:MAG: hypothetical protein AAGJ93_15975, partial [Bacteroidota bacterium]
MSKRHPIDELFSQHLANSTASAPDDMWERIAKQRQKPNPNKKIIGLTSLGLLATAVLVFAWLSSGSDSVLGHFPLEHQEKQPFVAGTTDTDDLQDDFDPTIVPTAIHSSPSGQVQVQNPLLATANSTTNSPVSRSASANTPDNDPIISTLRVSVDDKLDQSSIASSNNNPNTITELPEAMTPTVANTKDDTSLSAEETSTSQIAGPHQRRNLSQVNQLPNMLFKLADESDIKLFANHAPRCADFTNPFFHLDAEFLTGPAYASQMLIAKTNESTSHLAQRQESESARISTTTGFRLAATSNTGLGLRSGLYYSQINDKFTHHVGSKLEISVRFDPNGEVIGRDTVLTEAYDEAYTNRLKFVEVPLLLGYEHKVGKLRVGLHAGAFLNLVFDAKGTVLSPATEDPIAFGQEGDLNRLPIFERRATAAWYGGLSLAYNLHSRYSLLAEPFFKSYPKALSSAGYDLSQNYWMTG